MGAAHQRRSSNYTKEKKIYIPKSYRKKGIPKNVATVYRFLVPYCLGFFSIGLSLSLIYGIFTYNCYMPSWGTKTSADMGLALWEIVLNKITDVFLQFIGLSSLFLSATLLSWGGQFVLRRRISNLKSRILLALLSAVILSATCTFINSKISYDVSEWLPAGMGGSLGYLLFTKAKLLLLQAPSFLLTLLMTTVTIIGLSLWVLSLGFSNESLRGAMGGIIRGIQKIVFYAVVSLKFTLHVSKHGVKILIKKRSKRDLPLQYEEPRFDYNQDDVDEFESQDEGYQEYEPESEPEPAKSFVQEFKEKTFQKEKTAAKRKMGALPQQYSAPSLSLLTPPPPVIKDPSLSRKVLEERAEKLIQVLNEFGVKGRILGVKPGPVVTLYELEPAAGVKSARIVSLADDIARSMSARSARVSVIPGRNAMGIELPNEHRETVYFREILSSSDYRDSSQQLPVGLGKDIGGNSVIADLAKMPHLLVAGTTGSGKSVGINSMILSLLFKLSPEECKFIMIDPKMLELSIYDGIPHLLSPVVTEPKKAIVALKWVVQEMEARYRAMAQLSVRNIQGYNEKIKRIMESGEVLSRRVQTGFDKETGAPVFEDVDLDMKVFPYIVVVVDEMADLMLVAGKEIEAAVQRLAQMARAAGIHLIMATQRPSVDVITGTIKANFPTRISFQVTSKIDSRTILGEQGAEQLLGRGDMLYMEPGGRIRRVHGAFVADDEVERIVAELKAQKDPDYVDIYSVSEDSEGGYDNPFMSSDEAGGDGLYDKALSIVIAEGKVSTSFIQRQLSIGYNRAAKIVEQMEKEGVVSAPNHVGKRDILVPHGKGR